MLFRYRLFRGFSPINEQSFKFYVSIDLLFQMAQKETDTKVRPFYHSDLKNSLEKIIFKGSNGKEKGILQKLFSDKRKILKATVKALLEEIELRENLDTHLLYRIDYDICRQHTSLMHLNDMRVHYDFDRFVEVNKHKLQLEDNVIELEKEKRKEYLECWRDLMFLKKYLLSALREYWDLVKRREVLEQK